MPQIAKGDSNKVWVIPSEITKALEGLGSSIHEVAGIPQKTSGLRHRVDYGSTEPAQLSGDIDKELSGTNKAVADAIAEAEHAANPAGDKSHQAPDAPAAAAPAAPAEGEPPATPPTP
jgi:hypothetical protein